MKLSLERDIKPFLEELKRCVNKSHFDDDFLKKYTEKSLHSFDRQQWLSLFKNRKVALTSTEFSWTKTKKNRTVNRVWLSHALKVARAFSIDTLDLILPGESLDPKDRDFIKPEYDFTDLYVDDNENLRSFSRFVGSFEPGKEPYDAGYTLSLSEAERIKYQCDWDYFCQKILPTWCDESQNNKFKDCAYPLFTCVTAYFSMIENPVLEQDTVANRESINALIAKVYSKELMYLDRSTVYAFYAQTIQMSADAQMKMIEVLLACRGGQSLQDRLPYMMALAQWIGMQNPAMIIKHAALDPVYQSLGIGPHCTRERIRLEIDKLLEYSNELDSKLRKMVVELSLLLAEDTTSDDLIFNAMKALNQKFDSHNGMPKGVRSAACRQIVTTNDYVYNQNGVNAQIIVINQLLFGWGFLEPYGINCYYRFMMNLNSDIDPISAKLYSHYPLSHCVRPDDDRRYLAVLDNSVNCFVVTDGIFENVNANPQRPFTEDEYTNIQQFSAVKFRQAKYKRIAEYPVPPLKKSYLKMFTYLVNMSLDFKGLIDGYRFEAVEAFPEESAHQDDVIYIKIGKVFLQYSVKDRWVIHTAKHIYRGFIPTHDEKSRCSFFELIRDEDKLRYLLSYTGPSQHTRPNYSEEQLTRSAVAFTQVKQIIDQMPLADKQSLYGTRVRLGNEVITVDELWADGFPECMTYASKGFAVLVLTYFCGKIRFDKRLEEQSVIIGNNFIEKQRKLAQARTTVPVVIEDTNVLSLTNLSMFHSDAKKLLQLAILPDVSGTRWKALGSEASTRANSFISQSNTDSCSVESTDDGHAVNIERSGGMSGDTTDDEDYITASLI